MPTSKKKKFKINRTFYIKRIIAQFINVVYSCTNNNFTIIPAKTWTACKSNDPKKEECLKGAIQHAIRDLSNGGILYVYTKLLT